MLSNIILRAPMPREAVLDPSSPLAVEVRGAPPTHLEALLFARLCFDQVLRPVGRWLVMHHPRRVRQGFVEARNRLAAVLMRDLGLSRDDVQGAVDRWARESLERVKETHPPDVLSFARLLEDVEEAQHLPWVRGKKRAAAARARAAGNVKRAIRDEIVESPDVHEALGLVGKPTGKGFVGEALSRLFDRLIGPEQRAALGRKRPRNIDERLDDAIAAARDRARDDQRGVDFKIGTGADARRPARAGEKLEDIADPRMDPPPQSQVGVPKAPGDAARGDHPDLATVRAALRPKQYAAVIAWYAADRSFEGAAANLGVTRQAVEGHVRRAAAHLRRVGILPSDKGL